MLLARAAASSACRSLPSPQMTSRAFCVVGMAAKVRMSLPRFFSGRSAAQVPTTISPGFFSNARSATATGGAEALGYRRRSAGRRTRATGANFHSSSAIRSRLCEGTTISLARAKPTRRSQTRRLKRVAASSGPNPSSIWICGQARDRSDCPAPIPARPNYR